QAGSSRCGARARTVARAPGVRTQRLSFRPSRSGQTEGARRGSHAEHRRSLRRYALRQRRSARMNTATEALATPAVPHRPRPFYWSVRRELWEHRALYIVPLAVAALMLISFAFNAVHLPDGMRLLAAMEPDKQRAAA